MCFCCSWLVAASAACGDGVRVAVAVSALVAVIASAFVTVYDVASVSVAVSVYHHFQK